MTKNKGYKRFVRRKAAAAGESYQRMRERLSRVTSTDDVRSPEDRRRGRMLADLALRAADGKPIAAELDRAAADASRVAASMSVEDHLARLVGRDVAALAVAQQICRDALELNARDVVARDALALLERVARARTAS